MNKPERLVNRFLCTLHKIAIFASIVHARSVLSVQISTIKNCIMKRVFVFQVF
ncbi:Putative cytoplasmic protein [Bacteroides xylanisolvens SD CC 2a]|nr:Putative cytoplasmic protein [Bacteroides xylanisolvens SD CC 2a]